MDIEKFTIGSRWIDKETGLPVMIFNHKYSCVNGNKKLELIEAIYINQESSVEYVSFGKSFDFSKLMPFNDGVFNGWVAVSINNFFTSEQEAKDLAVNDDCLSVIKVSFKYGEGME